MNLKPTNPSEMIGFVKGVIDAVCEINKDLECQLIVSETSLAFMVEVKYIYELDSEGEAKFKYADNSFKWLKSESTDVLNKYIAELIDELTSVEWVKL